MKKCYRCKKELPLDKFHNQKSTKDGKVGRCKDCSKAYNKEWQAKNPEKAKESWKKSFKKNYNRQKIRLRSYGLTDEEYQLMKSFGGGGCHICGGKFEPHEYIDHCHKTGKVRGLLCVKCNTAIGSLNDDPILMRRAIDYVEKTGFFGSQATEDGQLPLKEPIREAATASASTISRLCGAVRLAQFPHKEKVVGLNPTGAPNLNASQVLKAERFIGNE